MARRKTQLLHGVLILLCILFLWFESTLAGCFIAAHFLLCLAAEQANEEINHQLGSKDNSATERKLPYTFRGIIYFYLPCAFHAPVD